jgi:hypothetical protein
VFKVLKLSRHIYVIREKATAHGVCLLLCLSFLEHIEMRPTKSGSFVGLVLVLFLFRDERGDVVFVDEWIFDPVLKLMHGGLKSQFDFVVLCAVGQVLPFMGVILKIEQLVLRGMQKTRDVLIFRQVAVLLSRLGQPIESSIRVVDQLVALVVDAELQVEQIR